jgi:hypothetical protein
MPQRPCPNAASARGAPVRPLCASATSPCGRHELESAVRAGRNERGLRVRVQRWAGHDDPRVTQRGSLPAVLSRISPEPTTCSTSAEGSVRGFRLDVDVRPIVRVSDSLLDVPCCARGLSPASGRASRWGPQVRWGHLSVLRVAKGRLAQLPVHPARQWHTPTLHVHGQCQGLAVPRRLLLVRRRAHVF